MQAKKNQAKPVSISLPVALKKEAIAMAKPNDVVLVAGKGHETYQEINGVKYPFDDREKVLSTFKSLAN